LQENAGGKFFELILFAAMLTMAAMVLRGK